MNCAFCMFLRTDASMCILGLEGVLRNKSIHVEWDGSKIPSPK